MTLEAIEKLFKPEAEAKHECVAQCKVLLKAVNYFYENGVAVRIAPTKGKSEFKVTFSQRK